jgi:hypothetical protein
MSAIPPGSREFRTPVYGTVFGGRSSVLLRLKPGDHLILVPDPPGIANPHVWVHAPGGDVIGHLSPDVNSWLVPWMLAGERYGAEVTHVGGGDEASWKRLVITVRRAQQATGDERSAISHER